MILALDKFMDDLEKDQGKDEGKINENIQILESSEQIILNEANDPMAGNIIDPEK